MRLFAVVGVLILLLLLVDVLETVFTPEGRGGPIHRLQNRVIWSLFRRVGRDREGRPRVGVLMRAGPVMAMLTLANWAALLILGFALIYLAWIHTFLVSPGQLRSPLLIEAIYYSGYTATSLGIGDMVPDLPALRLLTAVEAVSGLALVSVAVSYLISVYAQQGESDALALKLCTVLAGRAQLLLSITEPTHVDAVARQLESSTDVLIRLLQAYEQYPILHYFRPADPSEALPVQLGELLYLLRSVEGSALGSHPSFVPMQRTLMRFLDEVNTRLIPRHFAPARATGETGESERQYDRLLHYLCYR